MRYSLFGLHVTFELFRHVEANHAHLRLKRLPLGSLIITMTASGRSPGGSSGRLSSLSLISRS